MNSPTISVLIDTYNYGQFIEQAVDSVVAQDYPASKVEILVVDDGSTDDTFERLAKYSDRIRYLRKSNGGQASAFNFGARESHGDIVAFLDADDYWLPGKLRRVIREFETNPDAGMVHHRLLELDTRTGDFREGNFSGLSGDFAASRKSILSFEPTPTSSLAFRRCILEKMLPIPETITFQADGYILGIAPFLAPVVGIHDPLAVYRFHGSNLYYLSHTDKEKDRERLARRAAILHYIVEGQKDWFRTHGFDLGQPVVRTSLCRWISLLEGEGFAVNSPGRLRFVRYLLKTHWNYLPAMTRRHLVVSCINTFGALFTGYPRYHLLDEWRLRAKRALFGGASSVTQNREAVLEKPAPSVTQRQR
ncbi:MAG: glycosyltransferase [Candidatus Acidiferrales bacterium]